MHVTCAIFQYACAQSLPERTSEGLCRRANCAFTINIRLRHDIPLPIQLLSVSQALGCHLLTVSTNKMAGMACMAFFFGIMSILEDQCMQCRMRD